MALIDHFLPPLAFAAMLATEENLADTPFDTARADMDRLLDQAVEKSRLESPDQADDALFAVCAYADEAILDSAWPGRDAWMQRKLQHDRFNTANAGLEFYERLEMLCAHMEHNVPGTAESNDPELNLHENPRESIEVYVACLTLGFKGKYSDDQGKAQVDRLARSNLKQVLADSGLSKNRVFPEAYAAALPAPEPSRFHPALRVVILFGGPLLLAAVLYATYACLLSEFVHKWLGAL